MIQKKIEKLLLGENFVKSFLQRKFYQDGWEFRYIDYKFKKNN